MRRRLQFLSLVLIGWIGFHLTAHAQNIDVLTNKTLDIPQPAVDSQAQVHIRNVIIHGNKKTKTYIIQREIPFQSGDSIPRYQLVNRLQQARQQVYNTTLFLDVQVEPVFHTVDSADILILARERWYFIPLPVFQLLDRNLNEWLDTYKGDWKRTSYGIRLIHSNLSGRRDPLRISILNGFNRSIQVSYSQPYSNPALTRGFGFDASIKATREFGFRTDSNNILQFYNDGSYSRRQISLQANYQIRNRFLERHLFSVGYNHLQITDSINLPKNNPNYLKGTATSSGFIDISYTFQYVDVNNVAYPLRGTTAILTAAKRGMGWTGGLNRFMLDLSWNRYFLVKKNWYTSVETQGKLMLPFNQPFFNQRALGYGESYLRGLENYVIDGPAMALVRTTLKKKIVGFKIPIPFEKAGYPFIPITLFAKTYGDLGYVHNLPQYYSMLNNRLLYTGGLGIDFLTYYDINLRVEYSFNQLGERGLFFHVKTGL